MHEEFTLLEVLILLVMFWIGLIRVVEALVGILT